MAKFSALPKVSSHAAGKETVAGPEMRGTGRVVVQQADRPRGVPDDVNHLEADPTELDAVAVADGAVGGDRDAVDIIGAGDG